MLKQRLIEDIKFAIQSLGHQSTDIVVSIPENPTFGDYSSNIALQLANQKSKKSSHSPGEIANQIKEQLKFRVESREYLEKIEIAGPGFLNFFIKNQVLQDVILVNPVHPGSEITPQKYLLEYGHINLLKEIHIGHLRTFILGESLGRILESNGHQVFRANYQGDIGLHIAKAVWGINQAGGLPQTSDPQERANFLGKAYSKANTAYETEPTAKNDIDEINIALYQKDPKYQDIYQQARAWSLEYFEPIYKQLDIIFDRCFFESEVYESGKKIVSEHIGSVFIEDQGAVIFPGEKMGLHNRVFITSARNTTYEGKEIGLAQLEYQTFPYDQSIHVVASEQDGYFKVVIKAIEMVFPELKNKKYHLSYGLVDLSSGKMSSRTGNVVTIDKLHDLVYEKVKQIMSEANFEDKAKVIEQVTWGAIKFSYLKFSANTHIVFDLEQSVSLQGDSGPYLQYTYVRTNSIQRKSTEKMTQNISQDIKMNQEERVILLQLVYLNDIIKLSAENYQVNLLCDALLNLAKAFNLFYQKHKVIDSDSETFRLALAEKVGQALKQGLNLLGIEAPDKM